MQLQIVWYFLPLIGVMETANGGRHKAMPLPGRARQSKALAALVPPHSDSRARVGTMRGALDYSRTTPTATTATCEHGAGACGGGQMRVRPLPFGGVAVATECRAGRMRRCGRRGRVRGVRCLGTSPAPCGSVERVLGARNKHVITSVGSLALASQAAAIARVAS